MTDDKKYDPPVKLDMSFGSALKGFANTNPDELGSDEKSEIILPKASHTGEREVGGLTIPVYNLNDDRRVLSERGFLACIGAKGRGTSNGQRVAKILGNPVFKGFFSKGFLMDIQSPIKFLTETARPAYGFTVEHLNEFCIGFSKAKNAGALKTQAQMRYATQCETMLYAFAEIGVKAWVDEATGFQQERARDALQKILEKYLSDEAVKWSKTFPDEFYQEMFRLKGWKFTDKAMKNKPSVVGTYTNDVVYSRLAPGILDALREKNPVIDEKGTRSRKHHQWLSRDKGHPQLSKHIDRVTFLMKSHRTWDSFYRALKRAAPRLHETFPMDFGDD